MNASLAGVVLALVISTFHSMGGITEAQNQSALKLLELKKGAGSGVLFYGPPAAGSGYRGGFKDLKLKILVSVNAAPCSTYGDLVMFPAAPLQCYFLTDDIAYNYEGGGWRTNKYVYAPRRFTVLSIKAKRFIQGFDVDARARRLYHLSNSQYFLGRVGKCVFFRESANVNSIYCKDLSGAAPPKSCALSKSVVEVYGVIGKNDSTVRVLGLEPGRALLKTSPYAEFCRDLKLAEFK
jgi:hypothetical protein